MDAKFRIPFTFSHIKKLKNRSEFFIHKVKYKKESKLGKNLEHSKTNLTREDYIGILLRNFSINFSLIFIISTSALAFLRVNLFFLIALFVAFLFSGFVYFSQIVYPKIYLARKQKDIEKNLLPALNDMLVQLSSGIPLFNILTNISDANYGFLSLEFKDAVKKINAGEAEANVLDNLGKKNPSIFFRRTLWQISNGMKAGSDMTQIIRDNIENLNEEQLIQIQTYGSRLNPLVVLYMLISVIVPALSITFLTIITSMINLSGNLAKLLFISLLD